MSILSFDNNTYVKCKRNVRVNVNEDALIVKDKKEWFRFISFANPKLEIYLPEKEYDELMIDIVSGSVNIPESRGNESCRIETLSGSINIE